MTGADIVGNLLRADATLVGLVPEERIKLGKLPDGVVLPALLIRFVSGIDRQPLSRGSQVRVTERISATVRAQSYRDQRAIIERVRAICAGKTGNIGGGESVSILTAGLGPDIDGPGGSYEQSQDFRVSHVTTDA